MPGHSILAEFAMYLGLTLFFGIIILMSLRLAVMLSLLWFAPLAMILRRIPILRLLLPRSVREEPQSPNDTPVS